MRRKATGLLLALTVLSCLTTRTTQARTVRHPSPVSNVASHSMPAVDVDRLLAEDDLRDRRSGLPDRVGHPMRTSLTPLNSGSWVDDGDDNIWRLRVHSRDALWMVLGFERFRLQPGAELRVHDESGETTLGPFTRDDVRAHGQLWLPPVAGDSLVLELRWPAALRGTAPDLELTTVSHGYKQAWDMTAADSATPPAVHAAGSCNVDINCPAGNEWQDEKRGVVQLLTGGFAFCTGSLVNSTANDCRPYVLTAAHCLQTAQAAASVTFRFNYERSLCESGPADPGQLLTGATLVATHAASDFTLLELDQPVPQEFEAYLNGWSRDANAPTSSWTIHHPSGSVRKISRNDDPLVDGLGSGWGPTHWRITEWELGTTEPGSSGSPLFDPEQRIVGQLHGGTASCANSSWDEYGKLSVSWNGGGTPQTRLSDWLDPTGSGATAVDGLNAASCALAGPEISLATRVVRDEDAGNGNGAPEPGETFTMEISLRNDGDTATSAIGTLRSLTSLGSVILDQASWETIPPGAVETSTAPHFSIALDPSFACGDLLHLELDLVTPGSEPDTSAITLPIGCRSETRAIPLEPPGNRRPAGSQPLQRRRSVRW